MPPGRPKRDTPRRESRRRDALLNAAMEHVGRHGIGDLSLRELAESLGTSHRMLTYYFESKEGLLTEIVRAVEAAQRTVWDELIADSGVLPADRPRMLWRRLSAPEMQPYVRLFFEVYSQALQGRQPAARLLDGDIESWLRPTVTSLVAAGHSEESARTMARLGLAVTRGLLLDQAANGDHAEIEHCYELFLSLLEGLGVAQ
jgi:AcrR family transcriptional regulator